MHTSDTEIHSKEKVVDFDGSTRRSGGRGRSSGRKRHSIQTPVSRLHDFLSAMWGGGPGPFCLYEYRRAPATKAVTCAVTLRLPYSSPLVVRDPEYYPSREEAQMAAACVALAQLSSPYGFGEIPMYIQEGNLPPPPPCPSPPIQEVNESFSIEYVTYSPDRIRSPGSSFASDFMLGEFSDYADDMEAINSGFGLSGMPSAGQVCHAGGMLASAPYITYPSMYNGKLEGLAMYQAMAFTYQSPACQFSR